MTSHSRPASSASATSSAERRDDALRAAAVARRARRSARRPSAWRSARCCTGRRRRRRWPSGCSAATGRSLTAVVLCLEDAVADIRLEDAEAVLTRDAARRSRCEIGHAAGPRGDDARTCSSACAGPSTSSGCWRGSGRSATSSTGSCCRRSTVDLARRTSWPSCATRSATATGRCGRCRSSKARTPRTASGGWTRCWGCKDLLAAYRDLVPCMRIGATDLSGLWGLRRSRDFTVYDLAAVRDVIADVVNVFGRVRRRARDQRAGLGVHPRRAGLQAAAARDAVHRGVRRRTAPTARGAAEHGDRRAAARGAAGPRQRAARQDRHPPVAHRAGRRASTPSATPSTRTRWRSSTRASKPASRALTVGARMNEPKPHRLWARADARSAPRRSASCARSARSSSWCRPRHDRAGPGRRGRRSAGGR